MDNKKKTYKTWWHFLPHVLLSTTIIICLITSFKVEFNPDLGFYLSISKMIANGLIPFKDFQLTYTPLSFYLMSLPYFIFNNSFGGQEALLVILIFNIINTFLLYKILRLFKVDSKISILVACFYLMLVYIANGRYYVLEPIASIFGLSAIYLVYKKPKGYSIYAVLLGFLAFLTKQYALAYMPVLLGIVFFIDNPKYVKLVKKALLLTIAFLLPLSLFILYFHNQVGDFSFLNRLSGAGYGAKWKSLILFGIRDMISPLLLFIPLVALGFWKMSLAYKRIIVICFLGCFFFSFQFYFATWTHYYIFFYPFILIPIALSAQSLLKSKKMIILFIIAAIPTVYTFSQIIYDTNTSDIRYQQQLVMEQIKSSIDTEKKVCLFKSDNLISPYLFSELNLKPVNLLKNRFGFETIEQNKKLINDADYIILTEKKMTEINKLDEELHKKILSYDLVISKNGIQIFQNHTEAAMR